MRQYTKIHRAIAIAILGTGLFGCGSFDVPDYNNSSLQGLVNSPTPSGIATVAQGLLNDARNVATGDAQHLGILGREAYNLSVANGTAPTYLIGPLTQGVFFVISTWNLPYLGMRDANILLDAVNAVQGMTDLQKEGYRGFAKTMQAYYLMSLAGSRDNYGIPVDVNRPVTDLAPVATKAQAYAAIDQLLDQAKTHLIAAGGAFAFQLTPGFTGFNTPTTFLKFNRALKARADVYSNNYAAALTALTESFVDTSATASLATGVYHTFTTNSGDVTNPLFRSDFYWVNPSIDSQAHVRADLSKDLRFQTKVVPGATGTLIGVSSSLKFTNPSGPTSPLGWIRNEELILLRAEANLGCSAPPLTCANTNLASALDDINYIRVHSGGLAPLALGTWTGYTDAQRIDEVLYEKRYSLLWEGGFRWLDAKHYGMLATLPRDKPEHKIFQQLPYSSAECFQRQNAAPGCTTVTGL
jgi:hypothetical protein